MMQSLKTLNEVIGSCVNCCICIKECAFLQQYGTPGKICDSFMADKNEAESPVFECNLCGLCDVVCPKDLQVSSAFLEIRRTIQKRGQSGEPTSSAYRQHKRICAYEKSGTSQLLTLHHFPDGCDTVFFPGCALAGTRSSTTKKTYNYLQTIDPTCGIVLDCCGKPSHDLGLTGRFRELFPRLLDKLKKNGITTIITACPSCYVTFSEYAPEFTVCTIYEELAANPPQVENYCTEIMTIHDTCMTRHVADIHQAVRKLVAFTGAEIEEAEHNREKAICCGEGAAAACVAPNITQSWKDIRNKESAEKRVITYCAGCSSAIGGTLQTTHLLDLLFDTVNALQGKEQRTRTPFTYLMRFLLKSVI